MGYFDDIPTKGQKSASTSTGGGYFDDIPVKSASQNESLLSKAGSLGISALKGLVKLPARLTTNLTQSAQIATGNAPTEPFSGKFLGQVTPVGGGKDLSLKSLQDIGGAGLELASYLPVGKAIKTGVTAAKEGTKMLLKGLAKEGAVGGFLGATGSELQGNAETGQAISPVNIAAGTAGGAVLAPAIGIVSKGVRSLFANRAPEVRSVPIESAPSVETRIPISTPGTRYAEYRKSQGYEPYQNPNELPVIEMGPKAKDASGLPTIQMEPKKPVDPEIQRIMSSDSLENGLTPRQYDLISTIARNGKNAPEVRIQAQETAIRNAPKQPEPMGETITPALATRVETDAIEKGLASRFEGMPEAKAMNMRQQASDSANLVAGDYEKAKRVVFNGENPPGDLRDASVFEAVKQRAIKEDDVDTLRRLATESPIPSRLTAYGQEIKAADNLVDSNDPVELMQSVMRSKEKAAEIKSKGVKKQDLAALKEIRKKSVPAKVQDWDNFISQIEC